MNTKKLLLIVLFALLSANCATKIVQLPDGSIVRQRVPMPQVGIVLTIQNNCAPLVSVESIYGTEVVNLTYGRSAMVPVPAPFMVGAYSREVWVMVRAYTQTGKLLGTSVYREFVSSYQGTQNRIWQVDRLDSPMGVQCPSQPRY